MKSSKRKLKLLFIMDPMSKIQEDDTSVSLMVEAQKRGHFVFYSEPHELKLTRDALWVHTRYVAVDASPHFKIHSEKTIPVSSMDAVWIRKEPPVDMEFITMTYLLESVENKILMINRPSSIRSANEKLFGFQFKKWIPPSLVSSQTQAILEFQNKLKSDVVLKPLNRKGGEGIYFLPFKSKERETIIQEATLHEKQTVITQQFLKSVLTDGDKRILILDGEIIGAFGRIPKNGDFRANMNFGGTVRNVTVTAEEKQMVKAMKPVLRRLGLYFVGIDTIADQITEINVTSPAGIPEINPLWKTHLETLVFDWMEKRV